MVKARSSAPKVNPKVSKSVPDTPLMHWEQHKQSPWLWSLAFELGVVEIYLGVLPYVVVSTDYRPGDQSGRPEDPQTLLDCCYFLPPVCDWKRRSSAFIPTWAVFYSNQPFTARTGSKKKENITGMTIIKTEDEEGDIQRGKKQPLIWHLPTA